MRSIIEIINDTEIDLIETLNNTNIHAKSEYMSSDDMEIPDNVYGNSDLEKIKDNIVQLEEALKIVSSKHKSIQRIEQALIENNLKQNRFAYINDLWRRRRNYADDYEKKSIRQEHERLNRELFGIPDKGVFLAILHQKLNGIKKEKLSAEEMEMYRELLRLLGQIDSDFEDAYLYYPRKTIFDRFSELAEDFLEPIIKHIDQDKESFTIQEACDIANEILENELGETNRWHAVVEKGGATASVLPMKHEIRFPEKRSKGDYTKYDLRAILVHELGAHVLRSIPYTDCVYRAVSTGLPGYVGFEEGVARGMEQAVNREYEPAGYTHYISIGLIYYMKKNFREVYEIQRRIEHLAGSESEGRCFDSVQRAFRGTGDLLNSKDLAYYNGSVKFWKFIEEHIDDYDLFDYLYLSGKSDLTNQKHLDLIYALRSSSIQ